MQPSDRKRKRRRGDSKSRTPKRARKNRYHRGAKASEYTTLKILRGFAFDKTVQDLSAEMVPSEKTLRDIYMRLRLKLVAATLARPTDFGGAGLFMFRDRKLSNTGRQFLEAVRESGIYRMHMKRHAPRLSSPRDEKRFAFEVSVRVFCNIALDKEPASLYPPETREAVAGMREIAGWISDNREAIAAHDAYRQILDRFEKVVAQMGRLIEMEELLTLKTRSAEHHFPSSVLYDHLRRYLLTDPL